MTPFAGLLLWAKEPNTPGNSKEEIAMPVGVLEFSGSKLRAARRQTGLSRAELADMACRAPWTVGQYECGGKRPSPNAVKALARALRIEYADLLSIEDVAPDDAP